MGHAGWPIAKGTEMRYYVTTKATELFTEGTGRPAGEWYDLSAAERAPYVTAAEAVFAAYDAAWVAGRNARRSSGKAGRRV
jgi:hypothetical protein